MRTTRPPAPASRSGGVRRCAHPPSCGPLACAWRLHTIIGQIELTSIDFHHADPLGFEVLPQDGDRILRIPRRAAGEDVDRGVTVLRPRVDHEVTFGDDGHAGHTNRAEW